MTGTSKRRGWLASLFDRGDEDDDREYELVVLEGADADLRFRLDRPAIQIGRAIPGSFRSDTILLADRSVSARHALLTREGGRFTIEHLPSATNPTLVNGRRIKRKRLRAGDRIVLGLVVLELRAVPVPPVPLRDDRAASPSREAREDVPAELLLRDGFAAFRNRFFALSKRRTSIGRDRDCDIALDLPAVSRNHAALIWEDDRLFLIHESRRNPTRVNGTLVPQRREIFDGDEIRIAEQVSFEVIFARPTPASREQTARDDDEEATRYQSVAATPPRAHTPVAPPVERVESRTPTARPTPVDDEARTVVRNSSPAGRVDEERTVFRAAPPVASPSVAEQTVVTEATVARPGPAPVAEATAVRPAPAPAPAPARAMVAAEPTVGQPAPAAATVIAEPTVVRPAPAPVAVEPTIVQPAPAAATVIAEPTAVRSAPADATVIVKEPTAVRPAPADATVIVKEPTAVRPAPADATVIVKEPTAVRPAPADATVIVKEPTAVRPAPADATVIVKEPTAVRPAPADATVIVKEPTAVRPAPADATVIVKEPTAVRPAPADATVIVKEPTAVRPAPADATIVAEPVERGADRAAGATVIIDGGAEADAARIRSAADTLVLEGPDDEDDEEDPD